MNIQEILMEFGLNKNEAAVYLALIKLGLTPAGPVIKLTRLHRMLVYNALETLINRGLATVQENTNVKTFQASDPSFLTDKARHLSDLSKLIVPELHKLQHDHGEVVSVRTLIGHEGLVSNFQTVIASSAKQKDRTMRILGGAKDTDVYAALGDWYFEYVKLGGKAQIHKLLLAPANSSSVFRKRFLTEKNTKMKTLPHGLTSPTYTRITEEMVSIEMYKPQIVVIQIINKTVARSYLDSFELLWKTA